MVALQCGPFCSNLLVADLQEITPNQTYLKFSVEFGFRESDKLDLSQRRKGRQERRNRKIFSLRSWRLGAKNFVEVALLNILSVRI